MSSAKIQTSLYACQVMRIAATERTQKISKPKSTSGDALGLARPNRRPKIQDVAALTGVSLGTVSAVLNGNGRVSDATRERVQAVIDSLGYRPNLYASNLARRQTQLLGVVVSNLQNPFFAETAQTIEETAAKHGFQISLMATNFSPKQHRAAVQQLLGARIAGLAIMTSEYDDESRQMVEASGVPTVYLDVGKPGKAVSIIRVDSRGGMRKAVEHLLELGHRELLFVRNSQVMNGPPLLSHKLRDEGLLSALRARSIKGLKTHTVDICGPAADAGEQAIASVFGKVRFTAVIATTDMVAMGVYRGLQSRNVRIPEDVSVVGFDNTYFSRFLSPPLTTVDLPRAELSRLTIETLLRLNKERSKLLPLATRLVVRQSTAKSPSS